MMMNSPMMSTFSPAMAHMHLGVQHACTPAEHYLRFAASMPSPFTHLPSYVGHRVGGPGLPRDFYLPRSVCSDFARAQSQFSVERILGRNALSDDKDICSSSTHPDRDAKLAGMLFNIAKIDYWK